MIYFWLLLFTASPTRVIVGVESMDLRLSKETPFVQQMVKQLRGVEVKRLPFAVILDVPQESLKNLDTLKKQFKNIRFITEDQIIKISLRAKPQDPLYPKQWHLHATEFSTADAPLNLEPAWQETLGNGVRVAMLDDGFDLNHPDLVGRFSSDRLDISGDTIDADPSATPNAYHGTATTGIIAANWNALGVAGICPECSILPARIFSGENADTLTTTASKAATAIVWAVDHGASVINNSWGPSDGSTFDRFAPATLWELPEIISDAIDYAVKQGRNGLGVPILWAAGNGGELATYDRFASDLRCLAIGAIDAQSHATFYSDFGPTVDLVAPSSGATSTLPSIYTTDASGISGANNSDYLSSFGGTSAAVAMASGITALVLGKYPNLTLAQVYEALFLSAVHIDSDYSPYENERSYRYGYGRIDAQGALAMAAMYNDGCTLTYELCGNDLDDNCDGVSDANDESCIACIPNNSVEICDLRDNNCDNAIDEFFVCEPNERTLCAPCTASQQCASNNCSYASPDFFGEWCFTLCSNEQECPEGFYCRDTAVCIPMIDNVIRDCTDLYRDIGIERCDGLDTNGNAIVDDITPTLCPLQEGVCKNAFTACSEGHSVCNALSFETTETLCDKLDNDCDGEVDENCQTIEEQNCQNCQQSQIGLWPLLLGYWLMLKARHYRNKQQPTHRCNQSKNCIGARDQMYTELFDDHKN